MLLVPFIIGTGVSNKIGLESLLLLLAALSLFLARQPIVEIVHRMQRPWKNQESRVPVFWLAFYGSGATLFSLPLLFIYKRWWLIPLGVLGLLLLFFQIYLQTLHLDRETWAELTAIAGMSLMAPAAYHVSGKVLDLTAFSLWLLPFLYSGANVFYVKLRVKQRSLRQGPNKPGRKWAIGGEAALCMGFLMAFLGILSFLRFIPPLTLLAFSPLLLKTFWAILTARAPSSIKRLGYLEVAHSLLFTLLLILAYWLSPPSALRELKALSLGGPLTSETPISI